MYISTSSDLDIYENLNLIVNTRSLDLLVYRREGSTERMTTSPIPVEVDFPKFDEMIIEKVMRTRWMCWR